MYWRMNGSVLNGSLYTDSGTGNVILRKYNLTTGAGEGYIRIDGNGVNDLKYNAQTVWTSGNHGVNSGLNADLLDGQQGSWYCQVV